MKEHPAKFSDPILDLLRKLVVELEVTCVLDPFAGVGRVHELGVVSMGVEIEPEWAEEHERTIHGNALRLPFGPGAFDAIVTSPTYGNRMADHHNARDASKRNTYRHTLGRELHPANSGQLQWGPVYRAFHRQAWAEATRVLKIGGWFLLNVSDHIRKGQVQDVSQWHRDVLVNEFGYEEHADHHVRTRRQRQGANGNARVSYEHVYVLRRQGKEERS